jgi:hypothetical protein
MGEAKASFEISNTVLGPLSGVAFCGTRSGSPWSVCRHRRNTCLRPDVHGSVIVFYRLYKHSGFRPVSLSF